MGNLPGTALAIARGIHALDPEHMDHSDLLDCAQQGCLLAEFVVQADKSPLTVTVLAIEHKHGMDSWVFANRAGADAQLLEFVTTWWESDGPDGGDAEMPESPDERINQYFHHDNQMESYSINECEVQNG